MVAAPAGSAEEVSLCRAMAERDVRIGWRTVLLLMVGETGIVVKWSVQLVSRFLDLIVG